MIHIDTPDFNIDAVMSLLGGVDTNLVLAGTWNRIPWRIWLHEPTDTLSPAHWILEMGDQRYPLRQSSYWGQSDETGSWQQSKSSWRIRAADGRWIPALRDLGADLTVDFRDHHQHATPGKPIHGQGSAQRRPNHKGASASGEADLQGQHDDGPQLAIEPADQMEGDLEGGGKVIHSRPLARTSLARALNGGWVALRSHWHAARNWRTRPVQNPLRETA